MDLCKYPGLESVRTFYIEAMQIPIVYNRYGDYDPDGGRKFKQGYWGCDFSLSSLSAFH